MYSMIWYLLALFWVLPVSLLSIPEAVFRIRNIWIWVRIRIPIQTAAESVSNPDPDKVSDAKEIFFYQKRSYTKYKNKYKYKRHLINSSNTKFLQLFLYGDNFSLSGSVPNPDPHPIWIQIRVQNTVHGILSVMGFGRYYFQRVRLFAQ